VRVFFLSAAGCLLAASLALGVGDEGLIGERPAIERHVDQRDVDAGRVGLRELTRAGQLLFDARFNRLDGRGRPGSTGAGAPRGAHQPAFSRTSGPDANSCAGCHNQPRSGGAGDFVANVFVLAQERDPVVTSLDERDSNERHTIGMMGAGAIELLAREMTAELVAAREQAAREARESGRPVRRPLRAKGVSFGTILVDADRDMVIDELSIGDVTALAVYQAALATPGRVIPDHPQRRAAAARGEALFAGAGCTSCHLPALELEDPVFTEPGPYNPPGNLRPGDVARRFAFDLTREGDGTRLERRRGGGAVVRAYTDLKRHDINDGEYGHFANERAPQGTLAGTWPAAAFTEPPPPRPLRQFLTRKLWDVGDAAGFGHRGDLTTLSEAIHFHGGEARASRDAFFALPPGDQAAVIEFLKTLRVLPDSAPPPEAGRTTADVRR
jgi:cytochrome c peroxidase